MSRLRGRFAPTPSGELHIGNGYTALLAWLQIRQAGGQFILRIEDIDTTRSRKELAGLIMNDLRWLGIDWDEGPDIGGPCGPYTQSERLEIYELALRRLSVGGKLYSCFCSRAELRAIASAPHGLSSEGPLYPGTCRLLSDKQRAAKSAYKTPSQRFQMREEAVRYIDLAAGEQSFSPGSGGDFVIKRADGINSYQLAVVVDDALMGITDVLRGSDLLDSMPRQLQLYEALGYEPPRFAHVPLLHGSDGKRLAKRQGDFSIAAIREAVRHPEPIIGLLAFLCNLHDRPEPISARELIPYFDLNKLPKQAIKLDVSMLQRLHK
ncbi:tRNA glutamyl-Q(34) synthetase GluQRS [Paenibacillus abyssi]|uniref:Glutamyl-Q tRNA(Asp) synthetase n=1 Tax=Paenibacillus abyssi TaxID=1340531 RepID=A0A917FX82_9BACL|nr:tRNA glutamyl-Q(34) synthetase GluQRS [Paenibacillus abyssi]GGG11596.1 glutamyl-Q tRNA(Asp) synthetase [Paenibacillus abyssi]